MIPLKLKVDTKHRLLMLNTCNVDEYFQNTPTDLCHILFTDLSWSTGHRFKIIILKHL